MGVCFCYVIDEEEVFDILYEGFIKVFWYIGKYKFGILFLVWIWCIMVNMVIDYFCKNSCCCIEDMDEVYDISINDLDVISCCMEWEILEVI